MPSRITPAAAVAFASLLPGATLLAQTRDTAVIGLEWDAPGPVDCLSADGLRQGVEEQLGRAVFTSDPGAATLKIRALVEPTRDPIGWKITVASRTPDGEELGRRVLRTIGNSCNLADQLTFVVALMVDDTLAAEARRAESPLSPSEGELEPIEADEPEPAAPVRSPANHRWEGQWDLTATAGLGMLPKVAPALELGVQLAPPGLPPLRVRGTAFAPQAESVGEEAEVEFLLAHVGVAVCPLHQKAQRFWYAWCLGGDVGRLRASSRGLAVNTSVTRSMFQLSSSARAALIWDGVWLLGLSGTLAIPVEPESFVLSDGQGGTREIFQMAPVVVTVGVGAGFLFP